MDKRIAIDLDGVIYNIVDAIIIKLRDKFNIEMEPDDIVYYHMSELIPSITVEDEKEFFYDWRMYTTRRVIPLADKALEMLKEADWHITLLTGRDFNKLLSTTTMYLSDMKLVYDSLVFMNSSDKTKYMKEEGINYLVEDNGKTALEAANNGITVYLVDAPYNRKTEHKDIIRVKSLYDAVSVLLWDKDVSK